VVHYVKSNLKTPWPKEDFHDYHDYEGGAGHGSMLNLPQHIQERREAYRKASKGIEKPLINGECVAFMHRYGSGNYRKPYEKLRLTLPKLDRSVYVDTIGKCESNRTVWWHQHFFIKNVGIRRFLTNADGARAEHIDRIVEIFRRQGKEQAGFNLHALAGFFIDSHVIKDFDTMFREKFSPLFVCCDLFDRNVFAGRTLTVKVHAMNDSLHDERDTSVIIALKSPNGNTVNTTARAIGELGAGDRRVLDVKIPLAADLPTGQYTLTLDFENGKSTILSSNRYHVHVLGRDEQNAAIKTEKRVVAYFSDAPLAVECKGLLQKVGVSYSEMKTAADLKNADVFILGPDSADRVIRKHGRAIHLWIRSGGHMLSLEQSIRGEVPFLPGAKLYPISKPLLADLIVPDHPAFAGLNQDNWWMWNAAGAPDTSVNGVRSIARNYILPLNEGVISVAGKTPRRGAFGMVLSEIKEGNGICMFSQADAVSRYGKDSVATRYLHNLLLYTLGDQWNDTYAATLPDSNVIPDTWKTPDPKKVFTVDLRKHCNMGFKDEIAGDQKGGWADDGPTADMRALPVGMRTFAGVKFNIIDPDKNNGKSCIALYGKPRTYFPKEVNHIAVDKRGIKRLFFLVASAWSPKAKEPVEIARLKIGYVYGGVGTLQDVSIPLVSGRNIYDWSVPRKLPGSFVAWQGVHPLSGNDCCLYLVEWKNEIPEEIKVVNFVSTTQGRGVPILVAISGELE